MWAHIADDVGLCSNRMFGAQIVCFCDIPVKDFPIHMTKYGPFGLAFNKRWLVSRGANPVFYVASGDSPASPFLDDKSEPRADLLNEQVKDLYRTAETYRELAAYGDDEMEAVAARFTHALQFFLQPQVLAFMKCFDPALEDDNEENFYMEREWRVYGSVEFRLEDVARVLMPSKFAGRLRKDVPDYAGQVEFTA